LENRGLAQISTAEPGTSAAGELNWYRSQAARVPPQPSAAAVAASTATGDGLGFVTPPPPTNSSGEYRPGSTRHGPPIGELCGDQPEGDCTNSLKPTAVVIYGRPDVVDASRPANTVWR
jgi:hypothetical protein